MRISGYWLRRQIAGCLVMLLAVPFGEAATAQPQQTTAGQQATGAPSVQTPPQRSNTVSSRPSEGTTQSGVIPNNPDSAPQLLDRNQQSGVSSSTAEQQQNGTSPEQVQPLGTAAAPYEKTTGIAASRPAGAVIAPAKQRRTRSFLIKVGIILGAAVAVGTVIGLSKASPSRPN